MTTGQVNFLFDDDGRVISAINGSGTSAITAGDILYANGASTSPFGTTVPSAVTYDDIEVESLKFGTTSHKKWVVGVAMHDAAAGSQIAVATGGVFLSPVMDTTGFIRGGAVICGLAETTYGGVTNAGTTTPAAIDAAIKIGYALTSANVDGEYILWKFTK